LNKELININRKENKRGELVLRVKTDGRREEKERKKKRKEGKIRKGEENWRK
jgi:hypothetical protein